jgi:hypothetical protein
MATNKVNAFDNTKTSILFITTIRNRVFTDKEIDTSVIPDMLCVLKTYSFNKQAVLSKKEEEIDDLFGFSAVIDLRTPGEPVGNFIVSQLIRALEYMNEGWSVNLAVAATVFATVLIDILTKNDVYKDNVSYICSKYQILTSIKLNILDVSTKRGAHVIIEDNEDDEDGTSYFENADDTALVLKDIGIDDEGVDMMRDSVSKYDMDTHVVMCRIFEDHTKYYIHVLTHELW